MGVPKGVPICENAGTGAVGSSACWGVKGSKDYASRYYSAAEKALSAPAWALWLVGFRTAKQIWVAG